MTMTPITADTETRLIQAGKDMVRHADSGLTPNEALEKVAIAYSFGPDFIDRVGQLYNTSCTLRQMADTKGQEKRAIEHALADPGAVVEKLFAAQTSEKVAEADNMVKASLYEDPMAVSSGHLTKAAFESEQAPVYGRDPAQLLKRSFNLLSGLDQDVRNLDTRVFGLSERRSLMLQKAAAHFRRDGAEPFGEVESRIKSAYGVVGGAAIEVLWASMGGAKKLHKRAEAEPSRTLYVPDQTPYRELTEVIKTSNELVKARKQHEAAEAVAADTRKDIFKRASRLAGGEEEGLDKEAGISTALEFKGVTELIDNLVDGNDAESAQNKAVTNSLDPSHEANLRSIHAQSVFQNLMAGDPVIGQYDPSEVADAYNEISTLAPRISNQPAVLRGYLRRFLESSPQPDGRVLDTFEAGQLADLDKKMNPAVKTTAAV